MISSAAGGTEADRAHRIPAFALGGLTRVRSLGVEKYAFTLAFYLNRPGKVDEALRVLKPFAVLPQSSIDTRMLTADLLLRSGEVARAVTLYQFILQQPNLSPQQKQFVARQLKVLSSR